MPAPTPDGTLAEGPISTRATPAPGSLTTQAVKWALFDTLVQGTTVAVFQVLGVPIAPVPRSGAVEQRFQPQYPLGVIRFRARDVEALLLLSIPSSLCVQLQQDTGRRWNGPDLVRELGSSWRRTERAASSPPGQRRTDTAALAPSMPHHD